DADALAIEPPHVEQRVIRTAAAARSENPGADGQCLDVVRGELSHRFRATHFLAMAFARSDPPGGAKRNSTHKALCHLSDGSGSHGRMPGCAKRVRVLQPRGSIP